nr:MAG: hypothetical protein [Caudoviricetes sp.]
MILKGKSSSTNCLNLRIKIAFFCIGILIGAFGSLFWQEILSPANIIGRHTITEEELHLLQSETREKLLRYVEGKWRSSIGDLIVNIHDTDINGSFLVIENTTIQPKKAEKFKVISIDKVDGLFGIIELTLCSENGACNDENRIPIQINKVFGIKNTITISYDRRFSYCINGVDCTRAFKEVKEF